MHNLLSPKTMLKSSRKLSMVLRLLSVSYLVLFLFTPFARAAEKKIPATLYWMDVATQNMVLPGMPRSLPGMEGVFGRMGGPQRTLQLRLNSPRALPPDPIATHDIPPQQLMGKTLPLLIPERARMRESEEYHEEKPEKFEKPKFRMLIYWGCSDRVRPGQPKIIDTEKMSPSEFGRAMAGRTLALQVPPSERAGWIYADWPNRKNSVEVPGKSTLVGDHLVHGSYLPDVRFSLDARRDFMAPVDFASVKGELADSIQFQWKAIPTATGYFATATAHNQKTGEMIYWSSSDVQETGFGLMDYLPNSDVQKLISEKVIMSPGTATCAIPRGIFGESGGGMLQFIAYGEELNIGHPPRPKDHTKPHDYIWTLKVRLKSTGMYSLGSGGMASHEGSLPKEEAVENDMEKDKGEATTQPEPVNRATPQESIKGTINRVRGLFGF